MGKHILFKPPVFSALLLFLVIHANDLNAQFCESTLNFPNYTGFHFYMDWSSPTQIVFEGGACEPCQWWDRENGLNEEGAEICDCREDCDDDYDFWLENCINSCDHGVGCIADCYSDALDLQDECYDECGELPESSDFTWWYLEVYLW